MKSGTSIVTVRFLVVRCADGRLDVIAGILRRNVREFRPDQMPVVWTQVFARDGAIRSALDGNASLRRNWGGAAAHLRKVRSRDAQQIGESRCGSAACGGDVCLEIHSASLVATKRRVK